MPKTLSVTASSSIGSLSYNWTYAQSLGTTVPNTSITTTDNANTINFNTPNSVTYAGTTSGTYKFDFSVTVQDSGVQGCSSIQTISLYYNDTPPQCTLTLSTITVS